MTRSVVLSGVTGPVFSTEIIKRLEGEAAYLQKQLQDSLTTVTPHSRNPHDGNTWHKNPPPLQLHPPNSNSTYLAQKKHFTQPDGNIDNSYHCTSVAQLRNTWQTLPSLALHPQMSNNVWYQTPSWIATILVNRPIWQKTSQLFYNPSPKHTTNFPNILTPQKAATTQQQMQQQQQHK